MWSDYIDPQVVKDFEKVRGVRVVIVTYESNKAMLAKLQGGGFSYDIANPSNYYVQAMLRARLLQPLKTTLLPNFRNVAPGFLNPTYARLWPLNSVRRRNRVRLQGAQ